jgi:hypothetical protein
VDRTGRGLIAAAIVLLSLVTACDSRTNGTPQGGSSVEAPVTASSVTGSSAAESRGPRNPSGYSLPVGQRYTVSADSQRGKIVLLVGDVVTGPEVKGSVGTATESGALVYAEQTAAGFVYQAVRPGKAVIRTGEVPPAPSCATSDSPCVGRPAPPSVTVEVVSGES